MDIPKIGLSDIQRISEDIVSASASLMRTLTTHKVPLRIFADAVNALPCSVCITNAEREIIYVNDAFCTLFGHHRNDCIGKNCSFVQGDETSAATVSAIRQALMQNRSITRILTNYRADGSAFNNCLYIVPLLDENGRVYAILGTQQVASEAAIDPNNDASTGADIIDREDC